MVRSPCCEKVGLKKGPWTAEEDQKLLAYIDEHGHGSWRALPAKAGLHRCGKSCRLRWTNYLRPDIKRGKFSLQEEQTIIQLHALLGNRWSAIATQLSKRTDNEIKNYWNTHLKKKLAKMGIDPMTHKPKINTQTPGTNHAKDVANLSHMAQWESARLEAEARLVRDSKLPSDHIITKTLAPPPLPPSLPPCLDILKAWQRANSSMGIMPFSSNDDLESPTSTLNFPRNDVVSFQKYQNIQNIQKPTHISSALGDMTYNNANLWVGNENGNNLVPMANNIMEGFSDVFGYNINDSNTMNHGGNPDNNHGNFEEYNNYWSSILNLVNTSPASSPVF